MCMIIANHGSYDIICVLLNIIINCLMLDFLIIKRQIIWNAIKPPLGFRNENVEAAMESKE